MKLGLYGAVGSIFAVLLGLSTSATGQGGFEKYKKVEAYEVRPGILMLPSYTADNQVCEIGLQTLMYSPELITLDADLDSKEIDSVLAELVPMDERGKPTDTIPGSYRSVEMGPGLETIKEFENVRIKIHYRLFKPKHENEIAMEQVAVVVTWKSRVCR